MSKDSHAELTSEKAIAYDAKPPPVAHRPRRGVLYGSLAALLLIVALALGLGLGLGLGLKHHSHAGSTSASSNSSSQAPLPPLSASSQNNFVLDGLAGQSPQTRTYNFVISQVQGAPDGVSKPMLVVNGVALALSAISHQPSLIMIG